MLCPVMLSHIQELGVSKGSKHIQQVLGLLVPQVARRMCEVFVPEKLPLIRSASVKAGLVGPRSVGINQTSDITPHLLQIYLEGSK